MFENEKEYKSYIRGMDQYIEKLKKMRKDNLGQAKQKALASESGIGVSWLRYQYI